MKNKLIKYLCVTILLLTSCSSPPTNEVNTVDRLHDEYVIEEVTIPDELLPENDNERIQVAYLHDTLFRFYTLDFTLSRLAPVVEVNDFDIETQTITPVNFDGLGEYRVWAAIADEAGNVYEFISFYFQGSMVTCITYNGVIIENTMNLSYNTFNLRGFFKLNDKIYQMSENLLNDGKSEWNLYELDQGKATNIYTYQSDILYGLNQSTSNLEGVILPAIQKLSKDRIAWAIEKSGTPYIVLFDGTTVEEYEISAVPETIIPLKDYVYYLEYRGFDESTSEELHTLYRLDLETKESIQFDNNETRIGMSYQIGDNEFYSNYNHKNLYVCQASEQIDCRVFEEFQDSVIRYVFMIDEKTDAVIIQKRSTFNPKFYLIHWSGNEQQNK